MYTTSECDTHVVIFSCKSSHLTFIPFITETFIPKFDEEIRQHVIVYCFVFSLFISDKNYDNIKTPSNLNSQQTNPLPFQDCTPIRLKAVHIINQPFIFNMLFALFKPFLREKLRKRIYFHGADRASLLAHVDARALRRRHGGALPDPEIPGELLWKMLNYYEDNFQCKWLCCPAQLVCIQSKQESNRF